MRKEILTFGKIEIEKNKKFYHHKSHSFLKDGDIKKLLVPKEISCKKQISRLVPKEISGKKYKYFIGCLYNDHEVKPLHIMLPKVSAYVKGYEQTKQMSFLIEDDDLLEKYNTIWDKVSAYIKKEFDSELVYN